MGPGRAELGGPSHARGAPQTPRLSPVSPAGPASRSRRRTRSSSALRPPRRPRRRPHMAEQEQEEEGEEKAGPGAVPGRGKPSPGPPLRSRSAQRAPGMGSCADPGMRVLGVLRRKKAPKDSPEI